MPANKVIYHVNVKDVERQAALSNVTEDKETEQAIVVFCGTFNIPLDSANIATQIQELMALKQLLLKAKK